MSRLVAELEVRHKMLIRKDSLGFNSIQAVDATMIRPLKNKAPYDVFICSSDSFSLSLI